MSKLRSEVLAIFKKLHRTRQYVFQGDEKALNMGRLEINKNFRNNAKETNPEAIQKMIKLAHDVDKELQTNVIQAVQKEDNVFELRITPETTRLDNFPFNEEAVIAAKPRRRVKGAAEGCCGGTAAADVSTNSTK